MLDRERALSYDLDTAITLGEKLKCNCLAGEQFADMTATKLRALLWAGLVGEDPGLTEATTGKLIKMDRLPELMRALMFAWGIDPDAVADAVADAAKEPKETPAQPDPPQ
jgi:hypothetical protein